MSGQICRKVNGKWTWFDKQTGVEEGKSPAIHPDTMKQALRHPVTDEIIDSMTRWNATNEEHGLECCGNELQSEKKRNVPDKITEELILDRMEKAEAILSDPARRRAYENRQNELREIHARDVGRIARR